MIMMNESEHQYQLNVYSLALILIGVCSGSVAYWLISNLDLNVAIMIPSVISIFTGAKNFVSKVAPRKL